MSKPFLPEKEELNPKKAQLKTNQAHLSIINHSCHSLFVATPPSQRIQVLLGQDDDEEHQTHDVFCEMEVLRTEGDDYEWKEVAR